MAKTRKRVMGKKETEKQRAVAISKRRKGLFNKAAELSMFGDARVAILISSPSKSNPKFYSFGYPSLDAVFHDFLGHGSPFFASEVVADGANKRCALSLWREITELERDIMRQDCHKKKKEQPPLPNGLQNFLHAIEEESEKCKSVKELQPLVEALEKLRDKALSKPCYSQNSLPQFVASTSAAAVANAADAGSDHLVPKNTILISDSYNYVGSNVSLPAAGKTDDRVSLHRASASCLSYGGNFISFSSGNDIGIGNNQSSSSPSSSFLVRYDDKNSFPVGTGIRAGPEYCSSRTIHSNTVDNYFSRANNGGHLAASSFIHCDKDYEGHCFLHLTKEDKGGLSSKTPPDDHGYEQPFVVASSKSKEATSAAVPGSQFDALVGNWGTSNLDGSCWNVLNHDSSTAKPWVCSGLDDNMDMIAAVDPLPAIGSNELEDFIFDFM